MNSLLLKDNSCKNCHFLEKNSIVQDIPVILIAANRLTADKLQKFKLKAVDYINSPNKSLRIIGKNQYPFFYTINKQLNQQLNSEIRNKRLVREVANCICKSLDLDFIFQTTVEAIIKVLQCDRLTIVCLENETMLVKAQSVAQQTSGKLTKKLDFDYCRTLIEKQQSCGEIDVRVSQPVSQIDALTEIQSQLSAPILLDKTHADINQYYPLWGWLIAEQASPRKWLLAEIDLVYSLTAQLATALRTGFTLSTN